MEWNEERVATLTELWREGLSASQVARRLGGVTRNAVIGKAHRLGLANRDTPSSPALPSTRISPRVGASPKRETRTPFRAPPVSTTILQALAAEMSPTATLMSLADDGCRWPIGDPARPGFGFCGRTRARGGAYCSEHAPRSTEASRRR